MIIDSPVNKKFVNPALLEILCDWSGGISSSFRDKLKIELGQILNLKTKLDAIHYGIDILKKSALKNNFEIDKEKLRLEKMLNSKFKESAMRLNSYEMKIADDDDGNYDTTIKAQTAEEAIEFYIDYIQDEFGWTPERSNIKTHALNERVTPTEVKEGTIALPESISISQVPKLLEELGSLIEKTDYSSYTEDYEQKWKLPSLNPFQANIGDFNPAAGNANLEIVYAVSDEEKVPNWWDEIWKELASKNEVEFVGLSGVEKDGDSATLAAYFRIKDSTTMTESSSKVIKPFKLLKEESIISLKEEELDLGQGWEESGAGSWIYNPEGLEDNGDNNFPGFTYEGDSISFYDGKNDYPVMTWHEEDDEDNAWEDYEQLLKDAATFVESNYIN